MQIILQDGRSVEVEDARYQAFDALMQGVNAPSFFAGNPQLLGDSSDAIAFLVSQLAYTEAEAFAKLYQPMQFREFVPVQNEGGWADTIRYELIDWAGQGKRISGAGRDIPMAEVQFGERKFSVVTGGAGYRYTHEELMKSAMLRTSIPNAKLQAAMGMAERHLNQVALFGEAASGITGLYNNANVPQGNAPTGNWTGGASVGQILTDFNTGISNVWNNTGFNDYITDVLVAPAAFQYIASTPLNTANGSNVTILKYLQENNLAAVERGVQIRIRPGFGLNTAGVGSTRRLVFYVRNTNRVKMHIPVELNFLSPQFKMLDVEIPGLYRYSGVEFRYPKSAYYMDGV